MNSYIENGDYTLTNIINKLFRLTLVCIYHIVWNRRNNVLRYILIIFILMILKKYPVK